MRFTSTVLALFVLGAAAHAAYAGSVEVWPVRIELSPGQLATTLTVANRGEGSTKMQVRTFAWTQEAGADRLEPTREMLASPPIVELPPGATQVVRLLLRKPAETRERTYRLLLDELPESLTRTGVQMALQMSIPVFLTPPGRVEEVLSWRVERGAGDEIAIVAANGGTRHARLDNIQVTLPGGEQLAGEKGLSGNVLAGAERKWTVNRPRAAIEDGAEFRITATTHTGPVELTVPFGHSGTTMPAGVSLQQ